MADGLYSHSELVDSLIEELNMLPKWLIDSQFIAFCNHVGQMGQKLALLKKGIADGMKSKDEKIEELKETIRALGGDVQDIPVDQFAKENQNDGE